MRVFEIYDSSKRSQRTCAWLCYDEQSGTMSIQIPEDVGEAELPLMLGLFVQQGQRSVPDKWVRRWIEERVPPTGRQNLGEILRANNLDEYDALALLSSANGRSAQDDFLLREVAPRYEYAHVYMPDEQESSWCEVIGPKIAAARKSIGMTQQELAQKTGINQAAISRIESGKGNPTLNTLDALAQGVGRNLLVKIV